MKYDEVIEARRQKTISYIAGSFKAMPNRVHYIGERAPEPYIVNICGGEHHRQIEDFENPSPSIQLPPTITLDRTFENVDNVLNRKTRILAGQCRECGEVQFAELR